jgi:hypothetical protein
MMCLLVLGGLFALLVGRPSIQQTSFRMTTMMLSQLAMSGLLGSPTMSKMRVMVVRQIRAVAQGAPTGMALAAPPWTCSLGESGQTRSTAHGRAGFRYEKVRVFFCNSQSRVWSCCFFSHVHLVI